MEEYLAELKRTLDKITEVDERRANLVQYRDRQILALAEGGMTWVKLQEFTGLSVMGLKKALDRAKSAEN